MRGDITRERCDAIVNAANSGLLGGGGVDGAIHAAGGPEILEACRRVRRDEWPDGLPAGGAVATTAGRLPARYVIHTVGPVWHGGGSAEPDTLARCYRSVLGLAARLALRSVAFPSISTGAYGYPVDRAAPVALREIAAALRAGTTVTLVRCVLFGERDLETYRAALAALP